MRVIRILGSAVVCVALTACYTLEPTGGILPLVGSPVAFDLNDAGRVALGGSMGPEIAQIEGRLVSMDSTDYLVAVTAVRLLRGGEQVWKGEQIHVSPKYVSVVYERTLSKSRTVIASVLGIGASVLLGSQAISTAFSPQDPGKLPSDTAISARIPRP